MLSEDGQVTALLRLQKKGLCDKQQFSLIIDSNTHS